MRLPKSFAEQVRHQADIVQIVSDYMALKKRGVNYLALCPFHQEKTPSFNVHPGKQIFKCFGCGLGGDVFKFVMQMEGCDFPQAVRWVAERCGMPIPRVEGTGQGDSKEDQRERLWHDRLLDINRKAQEFFSHQLKTAGGRKAVEYLTRRGVRDETIEQAGIGYAPPSWEALSTFLRRQHIPDEQIVRSGLVSLKKDGQGHYDRFRERIIFPITDSQGRVVAFGGRALSEESQGAPKYLNSPETAVYTKGEHIFGLSHAKDALRQTGYAVLVEGYFDFLIPFQEGIRNVVASLGTALTRAQALIIRRYTKRVVVNFDPDPAGRSAVMRSLEMLVQLGFDVSVLVLPKGDDPDSFIRRKGVDEYLGLISHADKYLDFVIAQATEGVEMKDPALRAQALRVILPYVALIPDRFERVASGDRVASRLMLDPKLVREEVRRQVRRLRGSRTTGGAADATKGDPVPALSRVTHAERMLLEILLSEPSVAKQLSGELREKESALRGLVTYPLYQRILDCLSRAIPLDYSNLARDLDDQLHLLDLLERCFMVDLKQDVDELYQQAEGCLVALEQRRLEDEVRRVQREIELADEAGNADLSGKLSMHKLELLNMLTEIRSRRGFEVDAPRLTSP